MKRRTRRRRAAIVSAGALGLASVIGAVWASRSRKSTSIAPDDIPYDHIPPDTVVDPYDDDDVHIPPETVADHSPRITVVRPESVKVASYNVFWKAMKSEIEPCEGGKCADNIIRNIADTRADIICLQEATNWEYIQQKLHTYHFDVHVDHLDTIAVAYDTSVWSGRVVFKGASHPGRPYMCVKLTPHDKERYVIYVICLHAPHRDQGLMMEQIGDRLRRAPSSTFTSSTPLIICGDFNRTIDRAFLAVMQSAIDRDLQTPPVDRREPTCCLSAKDLTGSMSHPFDNILTNQTLLSLRHYDSWYPASDHSCIAADIQIA